MNEAAKAARREYKRKWNRENKDKVRQYQENYWNRIAQRTAEQAGGGGNDSTAETESDNI